MLCETYIWNQANADGKKELTLIQSNSFSNILLFLSN